MIRVDISEAFHCSIEYCQMAKDLVPKILPGSQWLAEPRITVFMQVFHARCAEVPNIESAARTCSMTSIGMASKSRVVRFGSNVQSGA